MGINPWIYMDLHLLIMDINSLDLNGLTSIGKVYKPIGFK